MYRNIRCKKVNELPGFAEARLWWRSRLPEEKTAFLSSKEYLFYPTIIIRIPIPLKGVITIKKIGNNTELETTTIIGINQAERLRGLYKTYRLKGWGITRGKDAIEFIRAGRVVCLSPSAAGRFLWP